MHFCDDIFLAVFPFEMLAFQRLLEANSGTSISFTHPAIAHLDGALVFGGSWQDNFIDRAERRLAEIESEVGIAPL